jgi:hypothetical protein
MTEQAEFLPEPESAIDEPRPGESSFVQVVARNIRVEAARRHVSLTTVATAIDLGQPALSRRMGGTVEWSLAEVLAVARYFGVPLSTIAPDSLTNDALR